MEKSKTIFGFPAIENVKKAEIVPEGTLGKLMQSLQAYVDKNQEGNDHEQKKSLIRDFCRDNAAVFKCKEANAGKLSMYFFSILDDNPQNAMKMWNLLYQISNNSFNQEVVNECFTEILTLNEGDTTMLWRIVHGIVRGYYEVKSFDVDGEEIFFVKEPEDKTERVVDTQRQKQSAILQSVIDDSVAHKPIPDTSTGLDNLLSQERDMFREIYQFLQEDSDFLVASGATSEDVGAYFVGKINKLNSFSHELEGKTDRQKSAYKKFLRHALITYIKPLFSYCASLKTTRRNPFAEDIFFETLLSTNNLFINKINAPTPEILNDKWLRLLININNFVHDNTTIAFIPAITSDTEVEELDNADEAQSDFAYDETAAIDTMHPPIRGTKLAIPKLTNEIPNSVLEEVNRRPTDLAAGIQEKTTKATDVIALIEEETLPLKNIELSTTVVKIPVIVESGSRIEETLLPQIKSTVDKLFAKLAKTDFDIDAIEDFKHRLLGEVVEKLVKTPLLRKSFTVAMLDQICKLKNEHDPRKLTLLNRMLRVLFNNLVFNPPYEQPKNYKAISENTKLDAQLMTESELTVLLEDLPDLTKHQRLIDFMIKQGTYKDVIVLERELKYIANNQAGQLGIHTELHELTFRATDPRAAFDYKVKKLEALCKGVKTARKSVEGNMASRAFTWMWRDKDARNDMKIYFDALEKFANELWKKAVAPGIKSFKELKYSPSLEPTDN